MNVQENPLPPRRTQRERRELSHDRMLEAATTLIARQGSSRTTLSEIGEASGYTHGLVSHRFGSKADLVRTLIDRLQTHFTKSLLPSLAGKQGLGALKLACETYLRAAARSERAALYVLLGEALGPVPEIRPEIAKADENFRRAVREQIESGIRAGEIRAAVDPAAQAALILATLRGLVIQRLLNRDSFDLDRVCRDLKSNLDLTLKRSARKK
ncbi:TetR/AcrR family transcriptional regulator [Candidatus Binatus sp.]|uniref:TetR/AcrR family transcriptional regulator n=1 Tax=Candidatus Binatus sp. TaxID=2811406 RepID=UPI003BAEF8AF